MKKIISYQQNWHYAVLMSLKRIRTNPDIIRMAQVGTTDGWKEIKSACLKGHPELLITQSQPTSKGPSSDYGHCNKTIV